MKKIALFLFALFPLVGSASIPTKGSIAYVEQTLSEKAVITAYNAEDVTPPEVTKESIKALMNSLLGAYSPEQNSTLFSKFEYITRNRPTANVLLQLTKLTVTKLWEINVEGKFDKYFVLMEIQINDLRAPAGTIMPTYSFRGEFGLNGENLDGHLRAALEDLFLKIDVH